MVNNSGARVVFMTSGDYPDTVNFTFNGCAPADIADITEPGETKAVLLYSSWEAKLDKLPFKTMMFFVYNPDSAAKIANNVIGCDSLRKRPDLILKRFDVDMEYLNQHDWKLVYP